MTSPRKFVFAVCLSCLLVTTGCDSFSHKKKKPTIPPRLIAPTIPTKLPDSIPLPPEPPPVIVAQKPPPPVEIKPAPKTHHRNNGTKKTAPATAPANAQTTAAANTTVAGNLPPEPPVPDTAIAAVVPQGTAAKDRQTTAEWLDSAEKTVKGLDERTLSDDQKAMVSQIWSYINQSRKATTDGDIERALNLASKAHLLSDALVKK